MDNTNEVGFRVFAGIGTVDQRTEYYLISIGSFIDTQISLDCEKGIFEEAFGYDLLVFRCLDQPNELVVINTAKGNLIENELTTSSLGQDSIYIKWTGINEVATYEWSTDTGGKHKVCFSDTSEWNTLCASYPFWVGDVSPDGKWVEVRRGDGDWPEAIAVLPSECLHPENDHCKPEWNDQDIHTSGWVELVSAWTPDSNYIIYLDAEGIVGGKTNYWVYDVQANEFIRNWSEPGTQSFRVITQKGWQPIWTPEGDRFLVIDHSAHRDPENIGYLVSPEDGSRTLLFEGGVVMGVVEIP